MTWIAPGVLFACVILKALANYLENGWPRGQDAKRQGEEAEKGVAQIKSERQALPVLPEKTGESGWT